MRKLMWITIGFAASCALCAYWQQCAWILSAAAVMVFLAVLGSAFRRQILLPVMAVLVGCLMGMGWFGGYYYLYLRPVNILEGQRMAMTVTVSDYSCETDYGESADGVVSIAGRPYQIRLYLKEPLAAEPGDRISGQFRIHLTRPEDADDSTWFQGKGIFLTASQTGEAALQKAQEIPLFCFPAVLRHRIQNVLNTHFPEDTAPFVRALLLGDTRELDYGLNTAFRISGIRHIVAVSGLHISVLYGLICVLTLRRRFLTAAVGMPVLLLFAAVAGFTPSAVRACLMVWLMMLAAVFDREYDAPTALAFAVLVMLLINPLAVTSVSMQLSAGCVAGILMFHEPVHAWLKKKIPAKTGIGRKLRGILCSGISMSVSASSLTTPLCALYFDAVSLVGLLTNLLTLWMVNFIFAGLMITCILSALSASAAGWLALVLSWPVRYVAATATALAALPQAAVYTKSIYMEFWLVFVYCLLAAFLMMKKKQPGILVCCGVIGLCIALLASWLEPLMSDTRITMLDVGQGQAILLQGEGKTFLVDCGGDQEEDTADIIADTLLSQGITRLDGIVITHYDRDHAGGLPYLLQRIDTDFLLLPDTFNEIEVPETNGQILYVWEDLELRTGSAVLRIFGPVYSGLDNENSLCVLFDTEKCDILITGDRSAFGERMLLRGRNLPDVDILVAGHHGAADATSEELLDAVTPETVLISVAEENIYGHPSSTLLERLKDRQCSVYRTDLHGTITIGR